MIGFWMYETSGVLGPVVEKYLAGDELTPPEIATMGAYLRQWGAGAFYGPDVDELRDRVDEIHTTDELRLWLHDAFDAGIDPL